MDTVELIEFSSDPAFALDGDLRVIGWNSSARELLGYSTTEAIGKKCSQVLQAFYPTGEPLCSVMCEGRSCMTEGNKWSISNCRLRHKTGKMITAEISTLVLPPEARNNGTGDAVALIFLRQVKGVAGDVSPSSPLRIFTLGQFGLAVAREGLDVESWKRKQATLKRQPT